MGVAPPVPVSPTPGLTWEEHPAHDHAFPSRFEPSPGSCRKERIPDPWDEIGPFGRRAFAGMEGPLVPEISEER